MRFHFIKMQGCGNDFLILDGIQHEPSEFKPPEIRYLCDRNFGVGADGLILLTKSRITDVAWEFFNSDGSKAEMCGNAARCVARYVSDKYLPGETVGIETSVGVIKGRVTGKEQAEVALNPDPHFKFSHREHVLDIGTEALQVFVTNTGVPHAVIEVKKLVGYPISTVAPKIQAHTVFQPQGTNVTFFERIAGNRILSTTFERGVNAETLACGTGAAAAALIYSELYLETTPIRVDVPGGQLEVDFSPVSQVLLLRGPATYVYEIEVDFTNPEFVKRLPYEKRQPDR